jgi:hypothetical protein
VRKWYYNEYDLISKTSYFRRVFDVQSSVKQVETDGVLAGIGLFPEKPEGANYEYDSPQQAYTVVYRHHTFALGLSFTKEAQEDELYGLIPKSGKELGRAAAYSQEVSAWSLFNNLTATVYTADASNYTLLGSQFRVDGGTWTNQLSTNADLSIESLELMLSEWVTGMVDQRGLMNLTMPKFLIHGPADKYLAYRLTRSVQQPQTNDNDINAVRAMDDLIPICVPFLTNDGRWFIVGGPGETGLVYFDRVGMSVDRFDTPENGNVNMVARFRSSSGATHPAAIMGSQGA